MRAVVVKEWTAPEALTVGDMDAPPMIENGVRIAIHCAGVNFADGLMVQGKYQEKPPFPFAPGLEVAGEVTEVAPGVSHVSVGDRVMAVVDRGGFAEEVVAHAPDVIRIPDDMDFATAAAFPVAYGTSQFALADRAKLKKGEVLVVHGAAGGVGLTAVECGKALGATVIATAGGPEKLAVAKEHGADYGIDYKTESIKDRVRELTGGRGADVIYDPVGGDVFEQSLRATAPDGRLIVIGFAGGTVQQIPANILLVKNVDVIGFYWGAYRKLGPERIHKSFAQCLRWYEDGLLKPRVSHRFPLEDAGKAILALKDRSVTGKAIVTVR
ncbi:Quinone oxidoreductase [Caenispirillum salinarum AK4]|uniref:Quinone oxidoreductase n=1 Tax=Caenispirillum salinarum AK4 TaxID=1238182 RepID=K9HVI3_9PROT|nr:NADPH:quinone oxidoreductase family protein [Caenispirillum salinarum]EKV32236.1 Quinone oxidoreductase [Caenispirillum salinarum AK4]